MTTKPDPVLEELTKIVQEWAEKIHGNSKREIWLNSAISNANGCIFRGKVSVLRKHGASDVTARILAHGLSEVRQRARDIYGDKARQLYLTLGIGYPEQREWVKIDFDTDEVAIVDARELHVWQTSYEWI